MFKASQTFDLRVIFNIYKKYFKTSINKYADIGSPCQATLSNLKYFVVFPSTMMQDSWFFKIILIQIRKYISNPNFQIISNKKQQLIDSNAFYVSTVTTKPSNTSVFIISKTSEITLPVSLINLF